MAGVAHHRTAGRRAAPHEHGGADHAIVAGDRDFHRSPVLELAEQGHDAGGGEVRVVRPGVDFAHHLSARQRNEFQMREQAGAVLGVQRREQDGYAAARAPRGADRDRLRPDRCRASLPGMAYRRAPPCRGGRGSRPASSLWRRRARRRISQHRAMRPRALDRHSSTLGVTVACFASRWIEVPHPGCERARVSRFPDLPGRGIRYRLIVM